MGALILVGSLMCSVGAAALAASPETSPAPEVRSPESPMHLPLELLWTGGLAAGYVSMNLKQNLRRRGHTDGDRRKRYSDLISLQKIPDQPSTSGARDDQPGGPARLQDTGRDENQDPHVAQGCGQEHQQCRIQPSGLARQLCQTRRVGPLEQHGGQQHHQGCHQAHAHEPAARPLRLGIGGGDRSRIGSAHAVKGAGASPLPRFFRPAIGLLVRPSSLCFVVPRSSE